MCSHICGVRKRYSLPSETDDIDRINNAIQQWKKMGKISARGFVITRLYSLTVPTDGKKMSKRAKLTAQCVYMFYQ